MKQPKLIPETADIKLLVNNKKYLPLEKYIEKQGISERTAYNRFQDGTIDIFKYKYRNYVKL